MPMSTLALCLLGTLGLSPLAVVAAPAMPGSVAGPQSLTVMQWNPHWQCWSNKVWEALHHQ